jgi:hypothetical protein
MKNVKYLAFLLSFFASTLAAEPLKNVRATKRLAENVVLMVKDNSTDQAFKDLKSHWPLSGEELDTLLAHTKEQRKVVTERFGKSLGVEFLRTEALGDSLVRHIFIEKFEKHALKWQISFYKPQDAWIVNSVYWDDKISELYR